MNYLMDNILCQTFNIKKTWKLFLTIEATEAVLVPCNLSNNIYQNYIKWVNICNIYQHLSFISSDFRRNKIADDFTSGPKVSKSATKMKKDSNSEEKSTGIPKEIYIISRKTIIGLLLKLD